MATDDGEDDSIKVLEVRNASNVSNGDVKVKIENDNNNEAAAINNGDGTNPIFENTSSSSTSTVSSFEIQSGAIEPVQNVEPDVMIISDVMHQGQHFFMVKWINFEYKLGELGFFVYHMKIYYKNSLPMESCNFSLKRFMSSM